jgi:hypothetical protein
VQVGRARELRLLRDQWAARRRIFREYQRDMGAEVRELVQAQSVLEAIRALEGPRPDRLAAARGRLSGGATRLQRIDVPDYLRGTHDLLVAAWRFAERATTVRTEAVLSGDMATAWEASSAAAGALMMLSRVQRAIRELLEPPRLP